MRRRFAPECIGLVFLGAFSNLSLAADCVVAAVTPVVRLVSSDGTERVGKYYRLRDCQAWRVTEGKARVMYGGPEGAAAIDVTATHLLLPPEVRAQMARESEPWQRMLDSLEDLLTGGVRSRAGQVRGTFGDSLTRALPRGKFAFRSEDIRVELPLGPGESVEAFELTRDSKPIYIASPGGADIRLPGNKLCAGCSFDWTAVIAGRRLSGSIQLEPPEKLAELERRLGASGDSAEGPEVRALRIATELEAQGYHFRARQILGQTFGVT